MLVRLTDKDGSVIGINPDTILGVRPRQAGGSTIYFIQKSISQVEVKECPKYAISIINGKKGVSVSFARETLPIAPFAMDDDECLKFFGEHYYEIEGAAEVAGRDALEEVLVREGWVYDSREGWYVPPGYFEDDPEEDLKEDSDS